MNYIKATYRRLEVSDNLSEDEQPYYETDNDEVNSEELRKMITEAMDKLPKKCRMIFDLSKNV